VDAAQFLSAGHKSETPKPLKVSIRSADTQQMLWRLTIYGAQYKKSKSPSSLSLWFLRPAGPAPFLLYFLLLLFAIYTALKVFRTAHENITVHNGGGKGNYSASGSSTLPGTQMGGQSRRRDWLGSKLVGGKLLGEGGGRSNSLDIRPVSSLLILSAAAFVHT
jgi:hypothetical protein